MQLHTLTLSVLHELHCVACVGGLVGGHPVGTSYNSREKTDKECVRVHVCSDKDGSTGWSFTLAHCLFTSKVLFQLLCPWLPECPVFSLVHV